MFILQEKHGFRMAATGPRGGRLSLFGRRLGGAVLAWMLVLFISPAFGYQQIEFVREVGEAGKKAAQRVLNGPLAVALSGDRVYIADTEAHRVVVMDLGGKTLLTWGKKGDLPGQFKYPAGIAADEQGRIYVADSGNGRIQVFDGEGKFLLAFGSKGSGPKKFSNPGGIAAARGLVYVADAGNSRVQILTADGIFIAQITVKNKKDEMEEPVDIAVDVQNRIYVLDAGANAVRVFDPVGIQVKVFGAKGKKAEGFDEPLGLAIDDRGNIFVADTGNYKLKKFDFQGKLLASVGSEGLGPGQFKKPAGLKIDREGRAYVLDAEKHTLQIFAAEVDGSKPLGSASPPASVALYKEFSGEVTALASNKGGVWGLGGDSFFALGVAEGKKIGVRGKKPGMLRDPRGIAMDADGNFWVADTENDRLQKCGTEGDLLQVMGKAGSGEGEFHSPSAVAVSPKGNIVVADTDNRRIQVFSPKGLFLGAFGRPGSQKGQFEEPVGVAIDGAENIYVVDRENNRIAKFDNTGTLLWEAGKAGKQDGEFAAPENILVSPDGELYVLDAGNARVQVFDANGKFLRKFGNEGKGPGEFRSPAGLALEAGIRLCVGDRGNKRIQVFTLQHTPAVPAEAAAQARMNEVHLTWKPNAETYLKQYEIYRSDALCGPFVHLATTTEPSYIDRGLPSNRTFHYCITSQAREGNESALSAAVSAMTPRLVPLAPKKVRIEASEKQITLSWLPNLEPFVSHYRIYRTRQMSSGFDLVAKVDRTVFIDGPLDDEALYYYVITSMGKEGDESQPSEVVFTSTPKASLTAPPIDIAKIEMREIFASAYKYYESHPLGSVALRNNTDIPFPSAKLAFSIKDYMDFPTEVLVPEIGPKQEVELAIKPVFNNKILEVTENTPLQSEIALTYFVSGAAKTVTRTFPVTLYERHAMTWDQKSKVGAFVTPKDPPVAEFARSVIQPYVDAYPNLPVSILYGRTIFAALGVYGLSYIVDPTSPFQEFSKKTAAVDYLQYPRDTLSRKSGDCDDLSILYAATLEDIGIGTALVDVPGHVFVMFNTGVSESERNTLGFPASLLVVFRGTVWIPVEPTMVGQSFTRAWQKGAEEYRDWSTKGKAEVIEIQKAWEQFRPVTLPPAEGKQIKVDKSSIEARFKDELDALGKQRLANLSADCLAVLEKTPQDLPTLARLGILYGENGLHNAALEQFQKMLTVDKNNAVALNNIGNIYFLQERLDDARRAYESSLRAEPDDTGVMVNLARTSLRAGRKEEAKKWFERAAAIDPRVLRRYGDLAADLGIAK